MMWFFAILVVLVMGGVAAVAAGRGAPMSPAYDDRPDALVPRHGPLRAEHVRRVRFSLAFRGYRMSEVDALLDRVARQLDEVESRLESQSESRIESRPQLPAAPGEGADSPPGQADVVDTPVVREVRGDDPPV
jgi:DivIVA domain-containing protein